MSLEVKGCFFRFISVSNVGGKVQIYFTEQAPSSRVRLVDEGMELPPFLSTLSPSSLLFAF